MIKITNEMLNGISPMESEKMGITKLEDKKCIPCSIDMPPMGKEEAERHLKKTDGWHLVGNKIKKTFKFKDFRETMDFVNKVADIAEEEEHHPDMYVSYGSAEITLWTHKIKGLHENDFIMATKINKIM